LLAYDFVYPEKFLKCLIFSVATFFKTLQSNEGDQFQLFYDDLPVYYVPASFKDKLYLMANLFTK